MRGRGASSGRRGGTALTFAAALATVLMSINWTIIANRSWSAPRAA